MAPYLIPPETLEYFLERGWTYIEKETALWRGSRRIFAYAMSREGIHYWQAISVNWVGSDHMVCTGPDPITCFITAELMNWETPNV